MWRKFFSRFSLRTLLCIITAVCILLALRSNAIRNERELISVVDEMGGRVLFGRPYHPQWTIAYYQREQKQAELSRILTGTREGESPCIVRFDLVTIENPIDNIWDWIRSRPKIRDSDIKRLLPSLKRVGTVKELRLDEAEITNAGIAMISEIPSIEVLTVALTDIDDACAGELASMPNLRFLNIFKTRLSENATREIQDQLPNCLIRGPTKSVGYFGHAHYADAEY